MWKAYTDGGAAPNPGPAAWGAVLVAPDGNTSEHCGYLGPRGTNQVAEITAAIEALKLTPEGAQVLLVSDSQYMLKGLLEWRANWQKNHWMNSKKQPVANRELWEALYALADKRKVKGEWVRGHNGHPQNERADQLVGEARSAGNRTRAVSA